MLAKILNSRQIQIIQSDIAETVAIFVFAQFFYLTDNPLIIRGIIYYFIKEYEKLYKLKNINLLLNNIYILIKDNFRINSIKSLLDFFRYENIIHVLLIFQFLISKIYFNQLLN